MRVVIAGAGHAGLSVAAHLLRSGHDVTVIDRDEASARQASEQHGLVALAGDATSARVLKDARLAGADVVVAMLRRDADNLAVALLAREGGVRRVMVRMRDTEYRNVYLAAGVHRILSETDVLIGAFATAIEHEAVRHSMVLGAGESLAFEIVVPPEARVVGRTVRDIAAHSAFPPSCVFAGLSEDGGAVEVPRGSSVITAGMALLLVVRQEDLSKAIQFFMGRSG
ncbi:MAG: TrkA family potassium uptake protein [Minicystis sp.]